jgi:hypothetical protein
MNLKNDKCALGHHFTKGIKSATKHPRGLGGFNAIMVNYDYVSIVVIHLPTSK